MNDSLAPGFLIALPHLQDDNFRHAVVLLLQQDETGAMGVVVNHESPLLLKDLCEDHAIPYGGFRDRRVRRGGPVQPEQGLVLYGPEHLDAEGESVVEGLHLSASPATLARLCNLRSGRFHCYAGYAGWAPGQLEHEITLGTWLTAPIDTKLILDGNLDDMWERSLRSTGIDPTAVVIGGAEA